MPRQETLRALRDLSNTLQTSIPAQGRGKLQAASLLNQQAKDQFQMGRQKKADTRQEEIYDLQKPGMQLESDKAQGALDRRSVPVDIVNLTGGNLSSMIHMAHVFKGFESEFGGKLDKDNRFIELENGKQLTVGDLESNPGKTERAFRAYTDRKLLAESKLDELGEIRANAKKGQYTPEQIQKFKAQYKTARLYRNNIPQQIADIQGDIDFFGQFNNPKYDKLITKKQKQIAKLEGAEAQKADLAYKEAQTKLAKSHASYYDRMPQAGKGSEASLKFTKEKRQLINDTMRHLGNNLGFGEGWGDMASMDDNQREAHRNYFPLVGAMAERGMYDGNPVLLGDAAMKTSEMIDAEVTKRAEKLSESRLKEKGITREQWAQQAKDAMMEQAINRLATQPAIKDNKYEFGEGDLEDIKNTTPGKGLNLKGAGKAAGAGLQGVAKNHEAFSRTPLGKTLGLPAINLLAKKGWDASTVVGDLMVDAGSDVADAVKWLFTPDKSKKK